MKVFDCFPFFNELELLELRLHTLNSVVDYFVLVEADKTHTNKEKPFIFEQNRKDFGGFLDKIIYVKVKDLPNGPDAWRRENYQRECISRGLDKAGQDDLIIVSDVDEIPNPDKVKDCWNIDKPASFEQKFYYYYVNCLHALRLWHGSVVVKKRDMSDPHDIRRRRGKAIRRLKKKGIWGAQGESEYLIIENGGWHFSYLGGPDRIIEKIKAFAHTETNTEQTRSPEFIREKIESAGDILENIHEQKRKKRLFGRNASHHKFVEIDETYPRYMNKLIEKYPYLYFNISAKQC